MCLRFPCFGVHGHDDDDYAPAPPSRHGVAPPPKTPSQLPAQQRSGHHNDGDGYRADHGGAEADRKASNGVSEGPAHAVPAVEGWHGHGAAGAQEKAAGADETLKQPTAWNNSKDAAGGAADGAPSYY